MKLNWFNLTLLVVSGAVIDPAAAASGIPTFTTKSYLVGKYPVSIARGFFDSNSTIDLAVADLQGNFVTVLLGNPDGSFTRGASYSTALEPSSIVVGDFNGDGKVDLAVSALGAHLVEILLGNGDGTFQGARTREYPAGDGPAGLATGDFNGDGKHDLAVIDSLDNQISILLGNGDGSLQQPIHYGTGALPRGILSADFNGDGKPDLAVAVAGTSVLMFLGNGDGTFQPPLHYSPGSGLRPEALAAGDFNGDGKLDIAIVCGGAHELGVVGVGLGNGDGTFQAPAKYPVQSFPLPNITGSIAAGDLNGDGRLDLVVGNSSSNILVLLRGNGDGTFQSPVAYGAGGTPAAIVTGDFKADGKLDMAVAVSSTNSVAVFLNQ